MKKVIVVIVAGFLFMPSSNAQDPTIESSLRSIRFIMAFSGEIGGDEVAKIFFANGESQSVNAGQGIALSAGCRFQLSSVSWLAVDATVSFKYVTTQAENAHIRLTRFPMHLMANYLINK